LRNLGRKELALSKNSACPYGKGVFGEISEESQGKVKFMQVLKT
jgi:hypothetical protein